MPRDNNGDITARRVRVYGLVQGVGFRPFVYRTAAAHNLYGWVKNTNYGVELLIQGASSDIDAFLDTLRTFPPPLSRIEKCTSDTTDPEKGLVGFEIIKSRTTSAEITRVSPDVCVCSDCLEDMKRQPNRIMYPFTNCTNCGPRFTIIRDLPYDRDKTTMEPFRMCRSCREEYEDIMNRRFHAQPNACSDCGPLCTFTGPSGSFSEIRDVLRETAALIDGGGIAAIKGLGGFHLVCDALNEEAVRTLRKRKHREGKPFALMARDITAAQGYTLIDGAELELLRSVQRPIVLLKRKKDPAASVAWGLDTIGVMLPYTPFHFLLFEHLHTDLIVATSGNISDEPIVIDNGKAFDRLGAIADGFVTYNRDIHNRCDDSVSMTAGGVPRLIRRSRGYVPEPIVLNMEAEGIAAFGGELKNTFCIGRGNEAILSQHIGDLKTSETFDFFSESYERFKRLFRFEPTLTACDLHPDYLSTRFAVETGLPLTRVQHHHAHIAACMAENRLSGSVIGISLDGTGYGVDGAVWGGEFLHCGYDSFDRYAHLRYVPLPGGDAAVREPWRMAVSWLYTVYGRELPDLDIPFVHNLDMDRATLIMDMIDGDIGTTVTSSMGRLFDAVSAVLGLVRVSKFDAEAPMKLESSIEPCSERYAYEWGDSVDLAPLWMGILRDIRKGESPGIIACRFHNTIAALVLDAAGRMAGDTGSRRVVLSGGVFQNRYLLTRCEEILKSAGFEVPAHRRIPANDGGISLGQLAVAAARRAAGRL